MYIINIGDKKSLLTDTYPSIVHHIVSEKNSILNFSPSSTIYGFVIEGVIDSNSYKITKGKYFSLTSINDNDLVLEIDGKSKIFLIERLGYKGQNTIGGPLEDFGRLVYIDGCSDSLLIYPPRLGDPSLNYLYFPKNINQTFHIHPSYRIGIVIDGQGQCDYLNSDGYQTTIPLTPGTVFYLPKLENHRFTTSTSTLKIIAFHPDGDWGPTDHNHSMLNRTYINK